MVWICFNPHFFFKDMFSPNFLKRFYLFLERREGRKRGRVTLMCERYINRLPLTCPQPGPWPATQARVLTGNRTGVLNTLSYTSQG